MTRLSTLVGYGRGRGGRRTKGYQRCVAHRSAPPLRSAGAPRTAPLVLAACGGDDDDNAGKYEAPGMVDALAASSVDTDLEARAASFHDVIDIAQQEAMFVPLTHVPDINGFPDRVGGSSRALRQARPVVPLDPVSDAGGAGQGRNVRPDGPTGPAANVW